MELDGVMLPLTGEAIFCQKVRSVHPVNEGGCKRTEARESVMMNLQLAPMLSQCNRSSVELSGETRRSLDDSLNELLVVIFFSLGPAIGGAIFLMWFGGLLWGLASSFLR